jgi:two-component system, OmpR family, alkaline phosphatase synthesis response regulator PhoP
MQNTNLKVLIVDDDSDILEIVSYNLKQEGLQVFTALNGREGVAQAEKIIPDLIILDIMMPEMDGMEACEILRENPLLQNTIITFFTARAEEYSILNAYKVGADDYITKPIKPKILISKVHALLRRKKEIFSAEKSKENQVFGITIDREGYKIKKDNKVIILPKKEFELFALLATKPGKVFTRTEILDIVWGTDVVVGSRTIDVHMRKLREKVDANIFKTIKGVGYKIDDSD